MTTLLGLDLAGARVLVAGGGPVAAGHAARLVDDGAHVAVVAPALCEDLHDLLGAREHVTWQQREAVASDLDAAWLVVAATDDAAQDARLRAWARARRTFLLGAAASAVVPATTHVDGVVVGVLDAEPDRAARVRDALAEHLRSGGADLRPRAPRPSGAVGEVVLVGGGPGAVDLLTLRGRRALARADVVVTDRLGPVDVLAELPADVEVVDVGKTPGHHAVPQHEIEALLVEHARRGRTVVRLKGGDPFVLGRGGEEVLACRAAGVPVEVVPGVTSALAAPALAGVPATHRGTSTAVHVTHGHGGLDAAALAVLADGAATLVVLMGVASLPRIVEQSLAAGADPTTPVAVVEEGSTVRQRVTRAPLQQVAEAAAQVGVRAPAVIVLGGVAAAGLLDPEAAHG